MGTGCLKGRSQPRKMPDKDPVLGMGTEDQDESEAATIRKKKNEGHMGTFQPEDIVYWGHTYKKEWRGRGIV